MTLERKCFLTRPKIGTATIIWACPGLPKLRHGLGRGAISAKAGGRPAVWARDLRLRVVSIADWSGVKNIHQYVEGLFYQKHYEVSFCK